MNTKQKLVKKISFLLLFITGFSSIMVAQNSILEARGMALGTVVTVKGIVTNGDELGIIRYFQDNTAGIAAYGSAVSSVALGDSVTITGTLKNYNQLLELDPLTSVVVRSSGNPVPAPIELTPSQIDESYEGMLVKVNNVQFVDAGGTFAGNKLYQFEANGETGAIYIKTTQTDIVGQPIPNGLVSITAICSQFDYSDPNAGYQLLPRKVADIEMNSSIYLTTVLTNTSFTKSELDFSWSTNLTGTTEMFYGSSAENVRANHTSGVGGSATHEISLSGISAGVVTWVQAFSVNGTDTAFSGVSPFTTISNSTGDIKVYFNSAVDNSYSTGVDAIYLPKTVDDTLIDYINRAKYTIDLTMYNFNNTGISNVSDALKAAANRGVRVRVIGCGTTNNFGIDELVGSAVHVLIGPSSSERSGIMHNKFIIFDAESADANDPLVWTGSTNLTDDQVNLDANNVIIIQDQSLARTYQIEFEEMWGSTGDNPDSSKALFGFKKRNNTPHEFLINGKRVECYFSPSDGVNAHIVENINTANSDLSIATMLITRTEMANAIADRKDGGVAVNVITNAEGGNTATVNTILSDALGSHYTYDDVINGLLHHKYMVVDQSNVASDPLVLTGSHNWSAAADNDNDENTLIVHDATIANIYYQNFVKRFVENNGVLFELTNPPVAVNDTVSTGVDQIVTVDVLANDNVETTITLSIEVQAVNGNASIPFTNPHAISYTPNSGFKGLDSITYKIAYDAKPELNATAKIYVNVGTDGISELEGKILYMFPNPVSEGSIKISGFFRSIATGSFYLIDVTGKQVFKGKVNLSEGQNTFDLKLPDSLKGTYIFRLTTNDQVWNQKLVIE